MRILYHHRIRSRDGQSVHLEELISAFRRLGHLVRLVGPRAFARSAFGSEPQRLQTTRSMIPPALYEILELCYNFIALPRLLVAVMQFDPDFIYERYNLYSLAGACVSRLLGLPLLLEVNAPLAAERSKYGGLVFPRLARRVEDWTWCNASAILPVTDVLARQVRSSGVRNSRIHVVPNAIDFAKFAETPAASSSKELLGIGAKLVVGFVGFARPWHGLQGILELLARPDAPPDLHALIVGEGPAIGGLRSQADKLRIAKRVTFTGLVEHSNIPRYLSAVDIALLPACVEYCSPLKLFEYMMLGKAIVAPDQPNIREVLTHGTSALLFPPQIPQSMAEAVLVLANDTELRNQLGTAAKSLIVSRGFTWDSNAQRVTELARCLAPAKAEPVAQ